MTLTPATVRSILGIPENVPVANALAFMTRWQMMLVRGEYGELTIRIDAGRESWWNENIKHKEGA